MKHFSAVELRERGWMIAKLHGSVRFHLIGSKIGEKE
jgi:hypothetical protein